MAIRSNQKKFTRKKYCFFCRETATLRVVTAPDYKNTTLLKKFTTDRGKVVGKTRSGLCASHQRELATAVKRARHLALLPYAAHI